jgi:hypothetical protein
VTKGLPMSVIIVFPDGTDWFKANWVFLQAKTISARHPVNCRKIAITLIGQIRFACFSIERKPFHDLGKSLATNAFALQDLVQSVMAHACVTF